MIKMLLYLIAFGVSITILVIVDIPSLISNLTCLSILKKNLYWIERMLDTFTPLLVLTLVLIFILWAKTNLSITMKSISVGGVEVSLKDSEDEVKNNVRNFLNTKRSLFKIIPEYDNFYDVFNSYHDIYEFLRTQLGLFISSNNQGSDTYITLQNMLKELNCCLTKYQSDYRRWYEKEIEKEFIPLSELQKKYPKYDEIVQAFKGINKKMSCLAEPFSVDTFLHNDLDFKEITDKQIGDKEGNRS